MDIGLILIPDLSDQAMAMAAQAGVDAFRTENWTLGAVLGGSFSLGDIETYHWQHGAVRHGMLGASLELTAAWKWLYFGMGALYLRDSREYVASTLDPPSGRPEFAGKHPEYEFVTPRQFLGARFGSDLKFNFEVAAMDDRIYNILTEPSDPIYASAGLTYGFAVSWLFSNPSPATKDGLPKPIMGPPHENKKPDLGLPHTSRSLIDSRQYWRATKYSALASGLGLLAGIAAGSFESDQESAIIPAEILYGILGAILASPAGSMWGAYTDPRYQNKARSLGWTAAGTAGGFGASILLAPVTGGLSFIFALPVGTVMGFQYGLRD
ncbi:MAG TPA: hypothetical protein VK465_08350 [Fibrobacteria bacterium]|nr:hypothetical protein [Fibrobacteria bacterium]